MLLHSRPAALRVTIAVLLLATAVPPPTAAQSEPVTPVPGAFCSLITNEEASTAFGVELVLNSISGKSCTWAPPGSFGFDASLVPALYSGTLAEQKDYYKDFPGGIADITVGGQPGLLRVNTDQVGTMGDIFTDALGEVLQFTWRDYEEVSDVDVGAALTQVTEAALPRMSSITFAEPTAQPAPSFRTDADLAALFPDTIGGQPVTVNTYMLADLLALGGSDPALVDQLTAVLAAQGKTIDDVSIGQVYLMIGEDPTNIVGIRIRGGDASNAADALLHVLLSTITDPQITAGQVAGRDATLVTDPSTGQVSYVLASGEVVWLVAAAEPVLTEIITALP